MPNRGKYPEELRKRVRSGSCWTISTSTGRKWEAIYSVADKLGPKAETVRLWVRRTETDSGRRPGATRDERAELKRLQPENAEPRRTNDILKAVGVLLRAHLDRQSQK